METQKKPELKEAVTASEISRRAYQLWEQAGHPHGRDLEFWLEAEKQLLQERKPQAPVVATAKAAVNSVETVLKKRFAAPQVTTPATSAPLSTPTKKRNRL